MGRYNLGRQGNGATQPDTEMVTFMCLRARYKLLQSKATNVSIGLVMYFKKQTFLSFQEIITL